MPEQQDKQAGKLTNTNTNSYICISMNEPSAEHMQHESSYNLLNLSEVGIQIICVASKQNS